MSEQLDRVREELFEKLTDRPCEGGYAREGCEFWDQQGHYCFLKDMHPDSIQCKLLDVILSHPRIAVLDEDQGWPVPPFSYEDECREYTGCVRYMDTLAGNNFRRILEK